MSYRPRSRRSNVNAARAAWASVALGGLYLAGLAVAGLTASPRKAEFAIVFGNAVGANGQPSPRLRARLETALGLYRAGTVQRVFVSGGIERPGDIDEAQAMAEWLAERGVPRAAMVEDEEGTDTFETARHAARLPGGAVAVTQWFHLPRAMLAMRRFGMRGVSGAWPRFAEPRDAYSFLREAAALPYYVFRSIAAPASPRVSPAARRPPA